MSAERVGAADRVLAGHDLQRVGIGRTHPQSGENVRRNELQDAWAHCGGDDVRLGDLSGHRVGVLRGADGPEAGDRPVLAADADLTHRVGVGVGQGLDQSGRDVGEDNLVAALVEQEPHESSADVASAEMNCLHAAVLSSGAGHHWLTACSIRKISSSVAAAFSA